MAGIKNYGNSYVEAVAEERLKSRPQRVDFIRVKVREGNGCLKVKSAGSQQTSVFKSFVDSDGLAVVPEGRGPVEAGEKVKVLLFKEFL